VRSARVYPDRLAPLFPCRREAVPWPELAVLVKLGWSDCLADAETRLGCVGCLANFSEMYSVIGDNFGGKGTTIFDLPNPQSVAGWTRECRRGPVPCLP
jgi:hypothetical protein